MGTGGKKRKQQAPVPGAGAGAVDGIVTEVEAPNVEEAPAKKKAKAPAQSGGGTFKAPDANEIAEIARTQQLYKSNLFRLQLEQVLKEISPKAKPPPELESFLKGLKDVLESLATRTVPGEFAKQYPNVKFHSDQPMPLEFRAPKRIDVVGSFLLGTYLRSETVVDVAMELPMEPFQDKDYVNFRYLNKRAAYTAEVFRQLEAFASCAATTKAEKVGKALLADASVKIASIQGDLYRPCIELRPFGKASGDEARWVVRLLPVAAPDCLPVQKLAPVRNSVRAITSNPDGGDEAWLPTAHYNSSLLEDTKMRSHLELLHKSLTRVPALREAIFLLKRWASARSFLLKKSASAVCTPLNGFCLSILAAHASQTSNVAAGHTSSFQLFKLALTVLSSTEWSTQKITFGSATPTPLTEAEKSACGAHFYDSEGNLNFFWRLGPFIAEIGQEAKRCLHILDTQSDPYEAVFGQQSSSPCLLWDVTIRTPILGPGSLCPALARRSLPTDFAPTPSDAPQALAIAARMSEVLRRGLGDRCIQCAPRLVFGAPEAESEGVSVLVGCRLDAPMLERTLDRGPSAEAPEAQEFKALWGPEKSELRRFRDGSVLECVVWAKPPAGREAESRMQPSVVTQIVNHLLRRHFKNLGPRCDLVTGPSGFTSNLGEKDRRLWLAFEEFRKHLTHLNSLPLQVKDVHPVDPAFSYMAPSYRTAPLSEDGVSRDIHNVVAEFESSGRWPDDPSAGRKVAAAMLLKIKEELQNDLGLESDVAEGILDVKFPEFVFRVQIFHGKDLRDVAHRVTSFQLAASHRDPPTQEDVDRLRALWWRPRIRGVLHAEVLQRPAMAGAVRLCQRWFGTQLLSGYEEFVEHLVTYLFLHPDPFEAPTSPQVALARLLWLLDSHDWQHEPLLLDLDGKLSANERLQIRSSFERQQGEGLFWVASRFDPHVRLLRCPPMTVGLWLQRRARHCLSLTHQRLLGIGLAPNALGPLTGWESLFTLDSSIFDLILRLDLPKASEGVTKADLAKASAAHNALEDFVQKLTTQLSPICLVFRDLDARAVALKWRPAAFLPQHQHVLMGAVPHTMLRGQDGGVPICVPNVLALTSLVASLGEGLVSEIRVVGSLSGKTL